MKYQLVLQWLGATLADYDAMIAVEDILVERLAKNCQVDGHDAGSGETNIFILTNDPHETFADVRRALSDHDCWKTVRVAYRDVSGSKYVVLWPNVLDRFAVA